MKSETDYILKDTMSHADILGFIKPWMKVKNVYTRTYNFTLLAGLFVVSFFIGTMISSGEFKVSIISDFFLGILLGFLIIPIHEWLHGIAYKILGAKSVQYRSNWKKLVFYAAADGFSTGYKEFRFVALMPFFVISVAGFIIMVLSGFEWAALMTGFIFAHTSCCGGDFGLLSYMHEHKDFDIITIDDVEKGETRFMIRG